MTKCFNVKSTGAAVAVALAALAGTAQAGVPGYVADSRNQVWTTPYGLCWKTTDWDASKAAAPCDAVARVEAPVPPPVAVAPPEPKVEPTPLVVAPPAPAPIIEQISLSSDVLFEFDKSELRPGGQKQLDEIAERLKGANVQQVLAIGHADRIGNEQYNRDLSEKRAATVKEYLASRGVDQSRVQSEGRGESQPVTGDQCKGQKANQKLIACLQPDRRVDIEVRGSRQVAGTDAPAGSSTGGATGSSSGSSVGSGFGSTSGTPSQGGQSPAQPGAGADKPGTPK
jgi:OOP family OmpA-OmpF porin